MLLVGNVQARSIQIEGIRILHGELARAQQTGARPRFIAKLRLDLVPDLRKLPVAVEFPAGDGGHDFFVGHAQAKIAPKAVLQPEHVVAHHIPAARLLPNLRGI